MQFTEILQPISSSEKSIDIIHSDKMLVSIYQKKIFCQLNVPFCSLEYNLIAIKVNCLLIQT